MLNSIPPQVWFDDAEHTWRVSGDLEDAAPLTTELDTRLSERVVVDLSEVTYLPSTVVGALALRLREARAMGGEVRLVAAPGTIAHRVLAVMALLHRDT